MKTLLHKIIFLTHKEFILLKPTSQAEKTEFKFSFELSRRKSKRQEFGEILVFEIYEKKQNKDIFKLPWILEFFEVRLKWLKIGICLLDQLFCDTGNLRYNESSLVGQIVYVDCSINYESKQKYFVIRCTKYKCYHKIADQVRNFPILSVL